MKKIGFNYEKIKKALLVERCDIIIWRHSYLMKIKQFWAKTFTWMSRGLMSGRRFLKSSATKLSQRLKTPSSPTGLKHPTAHGPRFVAVHAGGKWIY
jgi:hypothetical protein